MTFGQLLHSFFVDDKLKIVLVLIAIDFALGVIAAINGRTFRLSYVADFARNDLLGKVLPWFIVYAGAIVAGQQVILFGGITIGVAAGSIYGLVLAAIGASIANSLLDLGLAKNLGSRVKTLLGDENDAPPKD